MDSTCTACGKPFTASRADARYCSGRCRTAAYRSRTNPRPPRKRRALPEVARDCGRDVQKVAERIDRVLNDDRYSRHSELISDIWRAYLPYALEVIERATGDAPLDR